MPEVLPRFNTMPSLASKAAKGGQKFESRISTSLIRYGVGGSGLLTNFWREI